jgi:hypothetical protein
MSDDSNLLVRALFRVLDLTGDIDESQIRSAIGDDALAYLKNRSPPISSDQLAIKADREEAVRQRLREAESADDLKGCIDLADSLGMQFEADVGRRKFAKMYPTH